MFTPPWLHIILHGLMGSMGLILITLTLLLDSCGYALGVLPVSPGLDWLTLIYRWTNQLVTSQCIATEILLPYLTTN